MKAATALAAILAACLSAARADVLSDLLDAHDRICVATDANLEAVRGLAAAEGWTPLTGAHLDRVAPNDRGTDFQGWEIGGAPAYLSVAINRATQTLGNAGPHTASACAVTADADLAAQLTEHFQKRFGRAADRTSEQNNWTDWLWMSSEGRSFRATNVRLAVGKLGRVSTVGFSVIEPQ